MLDKLKIVADFDKALAAGDNFTEPYPLAQFRPFSDDTYSAILAHLPESRFYMELKHHDAMGPDGKSARLVLPLTDDRIAKLPGEQREFWGEFAAILKSDELRDVFKNRFQSSLLKRFDCPLADVPAIPKPMLMRDHPGYKINIHHDIDTKVITTQYYLPGDLAQRHLGTSIFTRKPDGKFELTRKLEFTPNNAYCFPVSKTSWHSVDPMGPEDGERNSMMLIYFQKPGIDY